MYTPYCASKGPGILEPPVKFKPSIDIEVLSAIDTDMLEDSFVYVHCYIENPGSDMLLRIWRTTFLADKNSTARARLMHAENISFAPSWTMVPDGQNYNFLLIFSALPKSCTIFDLIEEVPTSGGFFVSDIARNSNDVYHIHLQQ